MLQMEHFTDAERAALAAKAAEIPALIRGMIRTIPTLARPVIPAGGGYEGIWQEHNQDAYFLAEMFPEAAWGSMEIFMEFRMRNGLMPYCVRFHPLKIGFSQLQIVWPFARCALEIAKKLGLGTEELKRIYDSAAMFDRWLAKNRDHTGTGLVEMFCEYDTGHDRSRRTTSGGCSTAPSRSCHSRSAPSARRRRTPTAWTASTASSRRCSPPLPAPPMPSSARRWSPRPRES